MSDSLDAPSQDTASPDSAAGDSPSPAATSSAEPAVPSPPATWRRALATLGSLVLGAVFLVAAWAKSLDPISFAGQVEAEGLAFLLPAAAVALIALFLEWWIGLSLLLQVRRRLVVVPATLLVLFFVFLTGRTYWRWTQGMEVETDCGCFGNLVERTPAEAFWQDLLLMAPALLFIWLALGIGRFPRWRAGLALALAVAMTVFAWRAPDLPIDDLATRLRPGIDPFSLCAGSADGPQVCMDAILPEIREGEHLVILADLEEASFLESIPLLNEFSLQPDGPALWVLTSANEEQRFTFRFSHGPIFELREAPKPIIRPLYRTLPRSFRVVDGSVTETWAGLPPLREPGG